jgi:two-component system nitrogen regulation response regulator NtrX
MKKNILIIDDEKYILDSLKDILNDEGYDVTTAETGEKGYSIILHQKESIDLVLLDIWLPDRDGVEILNDIKAKWNDLPVIMMSGHANIETAVRATKIGALDFLEKPLSLEKVILAVENALKFKELEEENKILKQRAFKTREIIGNSPVITALKEQIAIISPTDAWVFIYGENGTGKELVAQSLLKSSKRAHKPLVDLNCAAIPEELIESELFGHEKGAFTGAISQKKGKFELADGGTLFLDEIADMNLKTQAKVLRVLQELKFERIGGTKTINIDVRIFAATNKDIETEIAKGNFREDLYYRLNVVPIHVPPLRERKEDIPLLIEEFLKEFIGERTKKRKVFSEDAMKLLTEYQWPGNVRELRNLLERLVILSRGNEIGIDELPVSLKNKVKTSVNESENLPLWLKSKTFKDAKNLFEKEFISHKLLEHNGNISKTAEAIGIDRRHLHRKIDELGLSS